MDTKLAPGFDGICGFRCLTIYENAQGFFQKLLRNPSIRRYDLRLFDMKGNPLLHKMARFR